MSIKSLFLFIFLHFLSREALANRLARRLRVHDLTFFPEVSGRVALYKLALAIQEWSGNKVALIPDYICNVVNIALEKAGFTIHTYQTDALLEPDPVEIEAQLSVIQGGGIFLVANVFGSSAFLESLRKTNVRECIVHNNIHVIVDLCQDISLISQLPSDYGQSLSAIVSFNDKSFPGMMGGGIITRLHLPESVHKMSLKQSTNLYRGLLQKVYRCMRSSLTSWIFLQSKNSGLERSLPDFTQYEYSYCRDFPYTLDILAISKLQLIMALIGLENLTPIYSKRKSFAVKYPNVVRTHYFDTSPYLIIDTSQSAQLNRKIKPSYAMHHHPEKSLRENLTIIHNKGFCDEN